MRYWIWWNDLIQGPFEPDELTSLKAFSEDLLVCMEDRQEWLPASRVADLSAAVEQLRMRQEAPKTPPPPPPKRAPSVTPLQGEFFAEPPGQEPLLDSDDGPKGPFAYYPVTGESEAPVWTYLRGEATMPFHFLHQPTVSRTAVIDMPRPMPARISLAPQPVIRESPIPKTVEDVPIPLSILEPSPAPLEPAAFIEMAASKAPSFEEMSDSERKPQWLVWILGVALAFGAIGTFGFWLIDRASTHSAISEANHSYAPLAVQAPAARQVPSPESLGAMPTSSNTGVLPIAPGAGASVVVVAAAHGMDSSGAIGGVSVSPSAYSAAKTGTVLGARLGMRSAGVSAGPLAALTSTVSEGFDSWRTGMASSSASALARFSSAMHQYFSGSKTPSIASQERTEGTNPVDSEGSLTGPASESRTVGHQASAGPDLAPAVIRSKSARPLSSKSNLSKKVTTRPQGNPSHLSKKPPLVNSNAGVPARKTVNGKKTIEKSTADSKPEALPGLGSAVDAVPGPVATRAAGAVAITKASPLTIPGATSEQSGVPIAAAKVDPWKGKLTEAIALAQNKTLPKSKITVGNQARALLQQMHEKELIHAAETGERLYLPDKLAWAALQEEGPVYRVYLNFFSWQASGERVQSRSYQFIVNIQRKEVHTDDPSAQQDLLSQPAELTFKHNPMATDIDSILGGVDTYNKHKVQLIIIKQSRRNHEDRQKIEAAQAASQAKITRSIVYFRRTYSSKALENVAKAYAFSGLLKG